MSQEYRVIIKRADRDERCSVTLTDAEGVHLYTAEVSTCLPQDAQRRAIMDMARYLHSFCTPESWR